MTAEQISENFSSLCVAAAARREFAASSGQVLGTPIYSREVQIHRMPSSCRSLSAKEPLTLGLFGVCSVIRECSQHPAESLFLIAQTAALLSFAMLNNDTGRLLRIFTCCRIDFQNVLLEKCLLRRPISVWVGGRGGERRGGVNESRHVCE